MTETYNVTEESRRWRRFCLEQFRVEMEEGLAHIETGKRWLELFDKPIEADKSEEIEEETTLYLDDGRTWTQEELEEDDNAGSSETPG